MPSGSERIPRLRCEAQLLGIGPAGHPVREQGMLSADVGPRNWDWVALKRIVLYLLGKPRLVWKFMWQEGPKFVSAFSDSNWAGCHDTRKSISGACIMNWSHLLKAYSRAQGNIALSSGEAEFYALVATASEALGIVAMTEDFGDKVDGVFIRRC